MILMASHFKWYPSDSEVVVPFNARYSFPSQANKAVKITPRIPPKNGGQLIANSIFRVEFPAQGYVNPANTTLEFDVTLTDWQTPNGAITRFQNNIQSIFSRVRLLYGSTPIEDIINYNQVVRNLTEWTGTTQVGTMDQTSISDGIGGVVYGIEGYTNYSADPQNPNTKGPGSVSGLRRHGMVNVRQFYIQGIDNSKNESYEATVADSKVTSDQITKVVSKGTGCGAVPNKATVSSRSTCTRRYQVNLALGLFTQEKLIPTKFMASQLAIEFTLETDAGCIYTITTSGAAPSGSPPTYEVKNVNLIPEILEFDASYDAMFLRGLQEGGVPIKFSSWHTFSQGTSGASNLNIQVQERSRSVKALFAVQRRAPFKIDTDSGATFFCSNPEGSQNAANTLQSYQFRIGGRYFPAAPVQCSTDAGGQKPNGGSEAFMELQKALNIVGDYRLSTNCNALRWALAPFSAVVPLGSSTAFSEYDYAVDIIDFEDNGSPRAQSVTFPATTDGCSFSGNAGSACFAMAIDLETSNGVEISGLNAEEQSDISLLATYKSQQDSAFNIEVYAYYDAMIILRENNVLELIQ
jgi:hypothetical protein